MFKKVVASLAITMFSASAALAVNMMEPAALKTVIDKKQPVVLVDIQPASDFEKHHLPGSIETNAFPAKKDDEKKRLDKALPAINKSAATVVVVCPKGKTGAVNSYNYLITKGVPEARLQVLKGGISDWPYKEMFVKGR